MNGWQVEQLTHGTDAGLYHAHSYYDLNVFDGESRHIVAHRMHGVAERALRPDDRITIGLIDTEADGAWTEIGQSSAWSWQQGPMAQWVPGTSLVLWNDRDEAAFVTRVLDTVNQTRRTLPIASYVVDPRARFTLGVNMARLDTLRPGYGYCGGAGARLDQRRPREDGVWKQPLDGSAPTLILSLDRAVRFLYSQLGWRDVLDHRVKRYRYWFNHVKIAPDGNRFTVKLRFRSRDAKKGWSDRMGVSLTCGTDGEVLALMTDATSHVIWADNQTLYFWRKRDGVCLYADETPKGRYLRPIAPEVIDYNVHLRYLPGSTHRMVFDTPYRESIDVLIHDEQSEATQTIAHFDNHRPARGQYRCDLHPCPSPDANKIVVTSLDDGARQVYLLRKTV